MTQFYYFSVHYICIWQKEWWNSLDSGECNFNIIVFFFMDLFSIPISLGWYSKVFFHGLAFNSNKPCVDILKVFFHGFVFNSNKLLMCGYSKINLSIILNGYVFLPTLFIFSQEYKMTCVIIICIFFL